MEPFRNKTIKTKIIGISLLTSAAVLLLACLVSVLVQLVQARRDAEREAAVFAELVATTSTPFVMFEDPKGAGEALGALGANPHILRAGVLNADGCVFARYARKGEQPTTPGFDLLLRQVAADGVCAPAKHPARVKSWGFGATETLELVHPMLSDGNRFGTVVVQMSLDHLKSTFLLLLAATAAILVAAFFLALWISSRLQKVITTPLFSLTRVMQTVSSERDYSLRALPAGDDEIGHLIEGFNEMLGQIQERDRELARHRDGLQQLVLEQTAELRETVELTRHARDVAEEASRAKSQFLANMSHEIRTPMNGVLGMTELLLGSSLNERQQQFAQTVRRSGEALLAIINDILDFSKIEAGKLELETIPFDLNELASETVELFAEAAQRKGVELVLNIDQDLRCTFLGDPMRLRQVITNLTSNAIKFTEKGEVVVAACAVETTESARLLRFTVSDTGIGIPPEARERIFDGFSQADGSMTRKYGGTGLGLAIVRQLSQLMGGESGVESSPGGGSRFWFTARLEYRQSQSPRPCHESLIGLRVLIVDDNATNRQILLHQVESWGMEGTLASCGAEALAKLRAARSARPFHVAILDMMMPEMDGIELAENIREDRAFASLRLVMLTSAGQFGDSERARAAGIEYYLSKPVRQSWLYNCLLALIDSPASRPVPAGEQPIGQGALARGIDVLLVEDNQVNQDVGTAMLQALGCRVVSAFNGHEALQALTKERFEVVLMDCQMPEMDGYEATRLIRMQEQGAAQAGAEAPSRQIIIALTAHALAGDREFCQAAGMDDYLSKPYTMEQIEQVLSRWTQLPGGASSALSAPQSEQQGNEPPGSAGAAGEAGQISAISQAVQAGQTVQASCGIDPSYLRNIRSLQKSSGVDLVGPIITSYLSDSARVLAALREAVAAADAGTLMAQAHYFKSGSATLGATRLADLCKELELSAKKGELAGVEPLLLAAEQEFALLDDHLRAVLREDDQ